MTSLASDLDWTFMPIYVGQQSSAICGAHTLTAAQDEASGSVTIDTVMPRVTGSLTMMTTDMDIGDIAVSGNFDIKRCF